MKRQFFAILILTLPFLAFADVPFATPLPMLPHFVPALVKRTLGWEVQTLSTYEMTTVLRLHPDLSAESTLDAEMQYQFRKLKRLMPIRAAEMEKMWLEISSQLADIQMDLTFPPGLSWDEMAIPTDSAIQPVAAVALFFDGRRSYYLDSVIFPHLTPSEQAQAIWQLLWSQSLQIEDNMAIRTISNYLFSKEWDEIQLPQSLPLLKKLGFTYFESQGLCFDINGDTVFYPNGTLQRGSASDKCLVSYLGQNVRLQGPMYFDPDGKPTPEFHLTTDSPWNFSWQGENFRFTKIELYSAGQLHSGKTETLLASDCANIKKPVRIITRYAIFYFQCLHEISFFPNGTVELASNAQAWVSLQGQRLVVGNASMTSNSQEGELRFYENGSLKSAYFPKGTRLRNVNGEMTELEKAENLILDVSGLVVGQY